MDDEIAFALWVKTIEFSHGDDDCEEAAYLGWRAAIDYIKLQSTPRYWVHNFGNEDGGEEFFDHPTGSDCPDCVPLYTKPPVFDVNKELLEALNIAFNNLKKYHGKFPSEIDELDYKTINKIIVAIANAESKKFIVKG